MKEDNTTPVPELTPEDREREVAELYEANRPKFHDWGTLKDMCIATAIQYADLELQRERNRLRSVEPAQQPGEVERRIEKLGEDYKYDIIPEATYKKGLLEIIRELDARNHLLQIQVTGMKAELKQLAAQPQSKEPDVNRELLDATKLLLRAFDVIFPKMRLWGNTDIVEAFKQCEAVIARAEQSTPKTEQS